MYSTIQIALDRRFFKVNQFVLVWDTNVPLRHAWDSLGSSLGKPMSHLERFDAPHELPRCDGMVVALHAIETTQMEKENDAT